MSRSWKKKRVLITGGTGFIGSMLAEELLKRRAEVRIPVRAKNYRALSTLRAKIDWVEGDLRDPAYCSEILHDVDHVFHLASYRRTQEFHRKHVSDVLAGNLQMTLAMIQALKEKENHPPAATFFSTANVPPSIDVIALAQMEDIDGYVLGKALCEAIWLSAARQLGFPVLIVRPVGVYGERDTFSRESNVVPSFMLKAEEGTELQVWGSGKQKRAFLYVGDLVKAVLLLIDSDADGIQYIIPPTTNTVSELAEEIRDLVNSDLKIQYNDAAPEGIRSRATLPLHSALRSFRWTPLRDGLKLTYEGWKKKKVKSSSRSSSLA